tara:strand:- start:1627 stop:2028 length:402 start_codon:yes stop_codon:yes gene_type:complete
LFIFKKKIKKTGKKMYKGKTQLTRIWKIKSQDVEKMKENANAHSNWMKETHHKTGDKTLHFLNWAMEYETNDGKKTGNIIFVLTEVYETESGVDDHIKQAQDSNFSFIPHPEVLGNAESSVFCDRGKILNSLW